MQIYVKYIVRQCCWRSRLLPFLLSRANLNLWIEVEKAREGTFSAVATAESPEDKKQEIAKFQSIKKRVSLSFSSFCPSFSSSPPFLYFCRSVYPVTLQDYSEAKSLITWRKLRACGSYSSLTVVERCVPSCLSRGVDRAPST